MTDIETLRAVAGKLTDARDIAFAQSLLQQASRRTLSEKQMEWVRVLTRRANGEERPRVIGIATDVAPIVAIFDRAAHHKRSPKLRLQWERGELLLTLAKPHHKVPGSINVKAGETWYGRILRNGTFSPAQTVDADTLNSLVKILREFADNPAAVAGKYGRETCRCCFCATPLENDGSREVGYGPVCASHHGLPWTGKASGAPEPGNRRKAA